MIVFDHNIPRDHIDRLRKSGLRGFQVGVEVGRPEWLDQQELLRYLHHAPKPTLFTREARV